MKVTINDSCIGCGACESICDAVFEVSDVASVKEEGVAGHEDCVKEAVDACPVGAIEAEQLDDAQKFLNFSAVSDFKDKRVTKLNLK